MTRATEMSEDGQITLGQLAREAGDALPICLSTHSGAGGHYFHARRWTAGEVPESYLPRW
ncbi:hypothetical protein AWC01_00420 [Mycobacterium doricum]|uniref:Uncharacterized protein n=1 Tax=Mycolicibacterium doricum TaxID=126673 RepID=A0A1X1SYU0_9MYCO|nr:hypothetical protein AWC01_00420 [Mycolicibacterium doricum]